MFAPSKDCASRYATPPRRISENQLAFPGDWTLSGRGQNSTFHKSVDDRAAAPSRHKERRGAPSTALANQPPTLRETDHRSFRDGLVPFHFRASFRSSCCKARNESKRMQHFHRWRDASCRSLPIEESISQKDHSIWPRL